MIFLELLSYLIDGLVRGPDAQLISQTFIRPYLQHISQIRLALYLAACRAGSFQLVANFPLLAAALGFYTSVMLRAEPCGHQSRQVFEPATGTTTINQYAVTVSVTHNVNH